MRRLLMVLLMLSLAGPVMASVWGNISDTPVKGPGSGTLYVNPGERPAGDDIGSAFVLGSLATVTGTTVGFTDDYDEVCPYTGSTAPDVVYSYTPAAGVDRSITISLCNSSFDTKLYVYQDGWTPGAPYACNDDYSDAACFTFSSRLTATLWSGHTYYIVIDGYSGYDYGNYQMDFTDNGPPPEPMVCPDGALIEGEPPCIPGNITDNYNGGCNSTPIIWQAVDPQAAGCATMCGKTCGSASVGRDTDWFEVVGTGNQVTVTCTGDFPLQLLLITGAACPASIAASGTGDPGVPVTLSLFVADGAKLGIWVGLSGFYDQPESNYVFDVCGIKNHPLPPGACCVNNNCAVVLPDLCALVGGVFYGGVCTPTTCVPIPTENTSWGVLKNLYR